MANQAISQFPVAGGIIGTELVPVVQNGVTVRTTVAQIAAYGQSTPGAALGFAAPLQRTGNTIFLSGVSGLVSAASGVLYVANSASLGVTSSGLVGQVLVGNGASPPFFTATIPSSAGVTSFAAGATGFTPVPATTGAITLGGTLLISSGGTGQTAAIAGWNALATGGTLSASNPYLVTQTWNNAAVHFEGLKVNVTASAFSASSYPFRVQVGGADRFTVDTFGTIIANGSGFIGGDLAIDTGNAVPAGGTQDRGLTWSTTPHFGLLHGSGAPTASQAQGSLYANAAATVSAPFYYNTNGTTGWNTFLVTGGPLGTPSSGTLTNCIGLPIAGLAGLGTGVSAALAQTVTGTGGIVLAIAPTLSSPVVGTQLANTNNTVAASTAFVSAAIFNLITRVSSFTASTTWTVNTNTVYAQLEAWGGGGGGGGTITGGANVCSSGAGGGAGSYSRITVLKATAGTSQTVTIGAAGTAGAAGNNAGGNGGDTSVGSLCVGKGGSGGGGGNGSNSTTGGLGGVAGTGDVVSAGAPGTSVAAYTGSVGVGGTGGSSLVGGGGVGPANGLTLTNGIAGTGHGSGGSGGVSYNGSSNAAGGVGTTGQVVVTEFCTH